MPPVFEPSGIPRLFGVAPGIDFPQALVSGLRERMAGRSPEQVARVEIIVNTRRMARRLREIYDAGPAGLLPRIRTLTDLDTLLSGVPLPSAVPPLRRRLELVRLVSQLLEMDTKIAPRSSLYALSDSLASLIDEMQGEGVSAETIAALDVSDQSGHWDRAKKFLDIAHRYLGQMSDQPDTEARQRQVVLRLAAHWENNPPSHPILLAGSTGSRGTTALLMDAVARLPQGALVLPGFDFDGPAHMWEMLEGQPPREDHPQYRFYQLLQRHNLDCAQVAKWVDQRPPSPERNALVSLSLRPAPVTDTWLSEGPGLNNIDEATSGLTLLEAATPRIEALAIAMRLRKAVDEGKTAALITPDRMLTRQVTSALDRWNLLPDDSAGTPLQLTPPGRFLRHVTGLFVRRLDAEALLTLLKHPLTHSGADRNAHQLYTQMLEGEIRRQGLPYPDAESLAALGERAAAKMKDPSAFVAWVDWVGTAFCGLLEPQSLPLTDWVGRHRRCAEKIAAGTPGDPENQLWKKAAGRNAKSTIDNLDAHAAHGGELSAADYADLIGALLSAEEVRDRDAPHPKIMIWGTLEARVQGADLVIMGGLNDGTWPEAPPPDPWLNRQMRLKSGLLLPERRIGLSAHDYQQAIAAPEVWLTRAIRSAEAETVPSRWVNRLENLLKGLPNQSGARAWADMAARGKYWTDQAAALEAVAKTKPAPRPSPRPPVATRPHALSVTEIKRLIRDPYAIYARHTLRLRPINPLVQSPDAPVRGTILHLIMELFIKVVRDNKSALTRNKLLEITDDVLLSEAPWPAARVMWRARIERIADWFIANEVRRQGHATPVLFEKAAKGIHKFEDLGFTLTGYADRIDRTEDGDAIVYDYKTGTPPSKREQQFFDKQLLIEAAMIEEGGFKEIGPSPVAHAAFIGLGTKPVEVAAPLDEEPPKAVLVGLHKLISAYLDAAQGFTSRRQVQTDAAQGDYDQLARFGEWDGTTEAMPEDLI